MKRVLNTLYCLFFGMLIFSISNGIAQNVENEEYSQITLERAIIIIEQKYKVSFSFSSDLIKIDKRINLDLDQKKISEALEQIKNQANIDYKLNGNQVILIPRKKSKQEARNYYIHGYIRDLQTREVLPDILVYCTNTKTAVYTNIYGYYAIQIPTNTDSVELQAHIVGYKFNRKIIPTEGKKLVNWDLETSISMEEIDIQDQRMEDKAFHKSIISDNVDEDIRTLSPRLLGEKDALAATRYYAGVNRETDISNGYNIRGGRPDQNLIILDDAPLYHSFHLFGLYSIFNEDALKQMNLMKSGFPARYGGRLSSVVEMVTKDGDMQNFHTDLGTGIIASRVGVEGPIIKDKLAFFVSGRSSHVNAMMKAFDTDAGFGYQFYDINTKMQWKVNDKHKLFASFYSGNDKFDGGNDEESSLISNTLGWGNQSATFRWNHILSPKWFSNTTLIYTNYQFKSNQSDSLLSLRFSSGVKDYSLKYDIDYFLNEKHHFKFGFLTTSHEFTPTKNVSFDTNIPEDVVDRFVFEEFALYTEDEINLTDKISTNIGLRYTGFKYRDFLQFNLEPRALITYIFRKNYALKASYGRMVQYSHYLNAFAGIGLPTDLWLPSTDKLLPEKSDQYTLGIYFNNKKNLKFNVEGFYKFQKNIVSYATNSSFFASIIKGVGDNQSWEERTMDGLAEMYGVEFQTEYHHAKYRALFAYTLSYSKNYFDELDYGKWFWANNDRRHNISLMNSYHFTKKWSVIATWIYTTGTPFTLPEANFYVQGHEPGGLSQGGLGGPSQYFAYDYKGINNYRMSSYHRLDININYKTKIKKLEFEMQVGAMNVYNRKNTMYYMIGYDEQKSTNELKRTAFLGIMPNLTLNIRF